MKKIILILVLISLALPGAILAKEEVVTLPELPVLKTIEKIGDLAFTILLALAAVMIVIGGILFVTAAGSATQATTARNLLIYALIGILIAFFAKGIVALIRTYLGA